LYVRRLQLVNFRNYRDLDLSLSPGKLVFLGDNAQGKSNLLEAVYLLASARSARAGQDAEMVGRAAETVEQPFARAVASVERSAGPVQVEALIVGAPRLAGGQALRAGKRLRVNGMPRRAVDLVGQLRAVLFTADDLNIISGGPAERRRFLDLMLSQADRRYYAALQRYGRVLQQRNAVLRRIREGLAGSDELAFWDESLAREGGVIVASRLSVAGRLASEASRAHRYLSGAAESLTTTYKPRLGDEWEALVSAGGHDAAGVQRLLAAAILSSRRRDVAAGASLVGPHRDDVFIEINGAPAAAFGSRAQIRTASLALRLAEARLLREDIADAPVVLLDDIVSELDGRRRRSVLEGIADFDQVWLTATDASSLAPDFLSEAHVFQVSEGTLEAV